MSLLNIGFVQELFAGLLHGGRALPALRAPLDRPLPQLCRRLLERHGDASQIVMASAALDAYERLGETEREAFFHCLLNDFSADRNQVSSAYFTWQESGSEADLWKLFAASEPQRQALLRALNLCPGGTIRLVRMREDLLKCLRSSPELAPVDADFSHLFVSWFNRGFLVLRQIDWNSPAAVLEKIVAYEAVHQIQSWNDLRRRLDPRDRRCYAFFHPATGDEPLIFVEVALCAGTPGEIADLLDDGDRTDPARADTAVFYSISNCQKGLAGVSFGNFLIKQVVHELQRDLPGLQTFVTLSPVPGFTDWLASEPACAALAAELAAADWRVDPARIAALEPEVRATAARYLCHLKGRMGQPLDPVARFHIGNGAQLDAIHWPADLSPAGLRRGHGVMVNYLYDLNHIDARNEAYASANVLAVSQDVTRLAAAQRKKHAA